MNRLAAVAALGMALAAVPGLAATCPFNIPVVSLPPGPHPSGFNWSAAVVPMGDPCVEGITVDPSDEKVWYVSGRNGLYVTHDGGASWTHPLNGFADGKTVALAPGNPAQVFAGTGSSLFGSTDKGATWKLLHNFPAADYSVFAAPGGKVYVGPHWEPASHPTASSFRRTTERTGRPCPSAAASRG